VSVCRIIVDMKKFRTVFSAVLLWHTGIMTVFLRNIFPGNTKAVNGGQVFQNPEGQIV